MEQDIKDKLDLQGEKLDAIFKSVEKTRKYFLWTLIVTIATVVLPLIALAFIIPWFLNIFMSNYSSLGL